MRYMVKFGFIAALLSLISCGDDFPSAPRFEFCKFELDGEQRCESVHVFTENDCAEVNGKIVESCE